MNNKPEFMTIREAAQVLGKQVRTIREWIHIGKIDAVKDLKGYRWLVFTDEVKRILEAGNADKD